MPKIYVAIVYIYSCPSEEAPGVCAFFFLMHHTKILDITVQIFKPYVIL